MPVDGFKWVDDLSMFTEDFIKNYDEESDVGYLLVVDIEYPKTLRMLRSDLPFLPDRMVIKIDYVILIQIVLLCILKQTIFTKILVLM